MARHRSVRELLAFGGQRRPPKFNFGQAVGTALQNAGQYFGQVALEKRNAEALEQARNFQLERDADNREFQTQERVASEAYRTSEREAGEAAAAAAAEAALTQGNNTNTVLLGDIPEGLVPEHLKDADPSTRVQVRSDTNGNPVAVLGRDGDFGFDTQGNVVRASAGNAVSDANDLTETETRYRIHGRNFDTALGFLEDIVGTGDGSDGGYDLRSFEAFANQAAEVFGGWGNWAQSNEGQVYMASVRRASESLFKGESGAAGSDQEAARYRSMFPMPGDKPEVVAMKFQLMNLAKDTFLEAGKVKSLDDTVLDTRDAVDMAARQMGAVISEDGFFVRDNAGPTITQPSASDEELFTKYGIQ